MKFNTSTQTITVAVPKEQHLSLFQPTRLLHTCVAEFQITTELGGVSKDHLAERRVSSKNSPEGC